MVLFAAPFPHPCGRALSRGRAGSALAGGLWVGWLLVSAVDAGPQPGARWSALGDERPCRRQGPAQDHETRRPGQRFGVGSHAPIRAPGCGVRMTVSPDPGCSVRSAAVLQAHAETRARPVPAFSDADAASNWDRM